MRPLKVNGYAGNHVQFIELHADPNVQQEPAELRIKFPGGEVYTARTSENEHWAHINIQRDMLTEQPIGEIKRIRADFETEQAVTQFVNPEGERIDQDFYHFAVLIAPKDRPASCTVDGQQYSNGQANTDPDSLEAFQDFCQSVEPYVLLNTFAFLSENAQGEAIPNCVLKRNIVREELDQRIRGALPRPRVESIRREILDYLYTDTGFSRTWDNLDTEGMNTVEAAIESIIEEG